MSVVWAKDVPDVQCLGGRVNRPIAAPRCTTAVSSNSVNPVSAGQAGSPRKGWSCHEPFAHPLAKARHTEEWPDVVAVCSAGMVLVEREAFQQKYNATCDQYCEKGAGPSVRTLMFGLQGRGNGAYQSCPGDKPGKDQGALCECSFPDRL
ncbi:unnamed protein product [Cladocopium goreaui]|uniref:Uncharacterized protein n=1 Tax=Cladocopium goreaui TaxID=2562237 RepID=A0A9P1FLR4_9DINO|nr:unnamed protein product [Cladocopium goreaui]